MSFAAPSFRGLRLRLLRSGRRLRDEADVLALVRLHVRDDLDPAGRDALVDQLILDDVRAVVRAAIGVGDVRIRVALDHDRLIPVREVLAGVAHLEIAVGDLRVVRELAVLLARRGLRGRCARGVRSAASAVARRDHRPRRRWRRRRARDHWTRTHRIHARVLVARRVGVVAARAVVTRHRHARRLLALRVTIRPADLAVVELGDDRLALRRGRIAVVAAVRRDAGRRRDREALLGLQRVALHLAHAPQIVLERQRRARADADQHALPILAGGVVDDRPALEHDLAVRADDDPIARLPRRRLGDVRQHDIGGRGRRELQLHHEVRAVVGLLARDRDRQRLARARVDDGQRLQEVIDAIARHADREQATLHRGAALVERDAVAIHDDAAERDAIDVDERCVFRPARGERHSEQDPGETLSHAGNKRASPARDLNRSKSSYFDPNNRDQWCPWQASSRPPLHAFA